VYTQQSSRHRARKARDPQSGAARLSFMLAIVGEPMISITIKSSKLRYVLLLIIAIGFVVLGLFILTYGKASDAWIGWMSIVFFGACIPLFAWQLVDSRPRLVLDDQGILDRTLGVGVIPWSEITGAYLRSIQGNNFICLEVRNPEHWLEHLSPIKRLMASANRALGFTALNLNLSGVAADPSQILELILKTIASGGSDCGSMPPPAGS
jgi:hypothetical protein